jgi:hypothetical protein
MAGQPAPQEEEDTQQHSMRGEVETGSQHIAWQPF